MRFLADESCDFAVVRALRRVGHDVLAVAEISPRAEDPDVVDLDDVKPVKNGECLRLFLNKEQDFQFFHQAATKQLLSVEWLDGLLEEDDLDEADEE